MLERKMKSDADLLDFMERVREAKGVSRGELENAVGISQGMISRWKSNQSFCKRKELYKIFEYLGIEFVLRSDALEDDGSSEKEQLPEEAQEPKQPSMDEYLNDELFRAIEEFLEVASLAEKHLLQNYISTAILLTKHQ